MNDYFGGLEEYLSKGLRRGFNKQREEIEITGIIEDIPRDMSKLPGWEENINTMTLSTSKEPITLGVTDEWREAILSGEAKKLVITTTDSAVNVLIILYSRNGGFDYLSN